MLTKKMDRQNWGEFEIIIPEPVTAAEDISWWRESISKVLESNLSLHGSTRLENEANPHGLFVPYFKDCL